MRRGQRSTPAGQHRPVLLDEVLAALAPGPGEIAVDCTVGWAGHAVELLRRVGPILLHRADDHPGHMQPGKDHSHHLHFANIIRLKRRIIKTDNI